MNLRSLLKKKSNFHPQVIDALADPIEALGEFTTLTWTDVASASTVDLGAVGSQNVRITGTTTITALGTVASGTQVTVRFAAALTLTHNATSLILPGGASITTAANDCAEFVSLGGGNWLCTGYEKASGAAVVGGGETSLIYHAKITGGSTTPIVLYNTSGATVTITKSSGVYTLAFSSAVLTANKTGSIATFNRSATDGSAVHVVYANVTSTSEVKVVAQSYDGTTFAADNSASFDILITIYP